MGIEPSKALYCKRKSRHMLLGCSEVASIARCSKDCWRTVDMIGISSNSQREADCLVPRWQAMLISADPLKLS